jgi:uncharacterized membrane protein
MDWILLSILSLIALFVSMFLIAKNDYFGFFTAGLFLIFSGIIIKNSELIYLGVIFAIISTFNINKWQRPKDWNQASNSERKAKIILSVIIFLLFLLAVLFSIK